MQGTILGKQFDAKDCLFEPLVPKAESPYSGGLHIYTFTSACSKFTAQAYQANSNHIQMMLIASQISPTFIARPLTPGTYDALGIGYTGGDLGSVDVNVQYIDGMCQLPYPYPVESTSGTVVVTKVDSSGIAGTFDVMFGADHLTGSFDAPTCGGPSAPASCSR